MMSKFTPGPWFVVEDLRDETDGYTFIAGYDVQSDSSEIIGCEGISGDSAENLANARLISAAPDLLEALEIWLADYDEVAANPDFEPFPHVAERVAKTRAAILKAKGETK
jgi:hypothetical protein